ncbi:MAG: hypothetical protein DRN49_03260 [Thaumarchaeota archaeon]|nr:MAG: hypothetical protein DRN49_03260 [Nitrososphaerota archaeon]
MNVSPNELREFSLKCFIAYGVPRDQAEVVVDHLIMASLRGVDSHGIIRLPYYLNGIEKGYVKPAAKIKILRETPVTALIDGGMGLGIFVATYSTRLAIRKAKSSGIVLVGAKNLGHVGMLAYYTKLLAENGLIGFACANGPSLVAPWGGRERIFGTNPISVGFPVNGKPVIIDMATSAMASFRIRLAKIKGEKIPNDAALDKEGRPTNDPEAALKGVLLPFGGHKGYAFSLMVEILSSALLGAPMSKEIIHHPSTQGGFLVAALDASIFRNYEDYKRDILKIIELIKKCEPMHGVKEVLLPGEPEELIYEKRVKTGIPIDQETWKRLLEIAEKLGIAPPKIMRSP